MKFTILILEQCWLVQNTEVILKKDPKMVPNGLKKKGKTVCFNDEAHNISGAGAGGGQNSNDPSKFIEAVLTKGDLKVVASQLGKSIENILKKIEH